MGLRNVGATACLCVVYTALNAALNFANRVVLGKSGFHFPVVLTASHMLFGFLFLLPLNLAQTKLSEHRRVLSTYWKELAFVGAINVIQISLNNASLVRIELSTNQVIRALLPIMITMIQACQGTQHPFDQLAMLCLLALGETMVVDTPDRSGHTFNVVGTLLVMLSVALQATQMTCAHTLLSSSFTALSLTYYTQPFAFLAALGPALLLDGHGFKEFLATEPKHTAAILLGTSVVAAIYNVVMTQTIKRLGAVGSAVLGNAKVVTLVFCSSLFMGEMRSWTGIQMTGAVLTFAAAGAYSLFRLNEATDSAGIRATGSAGITRRCLCGLFLGFFLAAQVVSPLVPLVAPPLRPGCRVKTGVDPCRDLAINKELGTPERASGSGELVLVTGGSGFIGSHLVEHLLELGYTVRVFDNLETGNLLYLDLLHERLEMHYGDIMDVDALSHAMVGVTGVFHLGAASKVLPSLKDPGMATFNIERNAVGTGRVLQVANATKAVRKVMYAASSTYYGNQPVPFEESDPFMPTSPYAASKYMGEMEMLTNDQLYHIPTLSLRFFMVYGPRNPSAGAYAIVTGKFLGRLHEGKPLLIEGTGENFRDFVHAKDIARALILGYQSDIHGTVINAGSGKAYSIKEVADLVSDKQVHVEPRKNDLQGTLANTCMAKRLLHFETRYDFVETMKAMINDSLAGRGDYLPPMWSQPRVHDAFELHVPGWNRNLHARENTAHAKESLRKQPGLLARILHGIRLSKEMQ